MFVIQAPAYGILSIDHSDYQQLADASERLTTLWMCLGYATIFLIIAGLLWFAFDSTKGYKRRDRERERAINDTIERENRRLEALMK